jgi:transcriptional regulator with XRE-family HTH domain
MSRLLVLTIRDYRSIAVTSVQGGHFYVTIGRKLKEMADVRILLARNMKHFREILGVSQMDLAEKIGCSPTLIGKIETMKRFPSADSLNRITEALKIAPADLFADADNSKAIKSMTSQQKRKSQLKMKVNKAIDEMFG